MARPRRRCQRGGLRVRLAAGRARRAVRRARGEPLRRARFHRRGGRPRRHGHPFPTAGCGVRPAQLRRGRQPRRLWPRLPGPGRQSQPPLEARRSDRHQRQDHHQLPAGQRAGHGGASGGVAGDAGLLRRRDLRAGVLDHAAAGGAGRLAGPHGRQRLHPRGDGSLQPCPEPVAGGGRPLRRRLRDQRQPRPPRLPPHDPGLPGGEVEAPRTRRARGLRGHQRRRPGGRRLPRPLRRPGLDGRHPLGRGNHRPAAGGMSQRADVSAHGRQRDRSRCTRG